MLYARRSLPIALGSALALGLGILLTSQHSASARDNVGAAARQGATNHTLSVSGHGEVSVPPNEATITLGVESKASDARDAQSRSSSKMAAVITAVQSFGVPAARIKSTNVSLWLDSQSGSYTASQQISTTLDDLSKVGPLIDAAIAAGADTSWGVSFGLKDTAAARSQALQAAVVDARKRADSMATALGVTVSGVGSASEATFTDRPLPYAVSAAPGKLGSSSTPVQPGELTVTADVNVTYTFG